MKTNNETVKPGWFGDDWGTPDARARTTPEKHDGIWTASGPRRPGSEGQRSPVYGVWMVDPAARRIHAQDPGPRPPSGNLIRRATVTRRG